MDRRPLVFVPYEDGSGVIFRGKMKGDPKYNDLLRAKLNVWTKSMVEKGGNIYAFTMTYSPREHGYNIVEAWQIFKSQLQTILRQIKKKFSTEHISVLESTKKGYPHAHVLLRTDKIIDNLPPEAKGGTEIKSGALYKYITMHTPSPIFMIQKAIPTELEKYLSKYVSKSLLVTKKDLKGKTAKLPDEKRKALLSCMLPILAGVRQFQRSNSLVRAAAPATPEPPEAPPSSNPIAEFVADSAPHDVRSLLRLLTNLTHSCREGVLAIFNPAHSHPLEGTEGFYEQFPADLRTYFRLVGYVLNCPGCPILDYLRHIAPTLSDEELSQPIQYFMPLENTPNDDDFTKHKGAL